MPVTISDIAQVVGKSAPTVSRALNNHAKISLKTRQTIQAAAEKLGYRPSFVGSCLKSGCTNILSVIVPQLTNPFYAHQISEVKKLVMPRNYDVAAYDFDLNRDLERKCLDRMLGRCCDGVITSLTAFEHTGDILNKMWRARIPCVVIGSPLDEHRHVKFDAVDIDSGVAWDELLQLLKKAGHRNIVLAAGALHDSVFGYFADSIKSGFEKAEIPFNSNHSIHRLSKSTGSYPQDGEISARQIFHDHPDVTAIIAINDFLAYGIMHAAAKLHRRIPEDLVLIGRDKTWISEYAPSPLPTIDQRLDLVAAEATKIIFERLADPDWQEPKRIVIKGKLFHAELLESRF